MALPIGTQAPTFTLKSKTTEGLVDISLADNFGKSATVLLFFPAAFTSVCTTEMCDLSGGIQKYADLGAKVIAISVDTPFAQEAWAKKEGITVPLVSDLNKTVTLSYDVLFPNLADIGDTSARAAFVIDKTGTIVYSEQTPTPKDLPDFAKIEAALKAL
jgi:glutaredoxin-dependent peroxiredoxin